MRTALLLLLAIQPLAAQPERFGLPACTGPNREIAVRTGFTMWFDAMHKTPLWSAYELTAERLSAAAGVRRARHFRHDAELSSAFDSDYRLSGYSRGHVVPAADVAWSEGGLRDSFLLSNAVPQNGALNSGKWRVLENAVRKLAVTSDFVVVFTGPVLCEGAAHIGASSVTVPCELYKVVIAGKGGELKMFAAMLPNDRNPGEPLSAFLTPVAEVERRTGLDFCHALPADVQARLEAEVNPLP
ncbi:MAG: DNA/RNA non-specific endonuclease [Acidobacteria bacterium]|nr:DNA/RNA non-specific endonuclease [Acidobacteriota bacterium]